MLLPVGDVTLCAAGHVIAGGSGTGVGVEGPQPAAAAAMSAATALKGDGIPTILG
jgi:hypothetical protein